MTPSNFLKVHINIVFLSTSWSPQWPLSLRLPHQHPVTPLSSPIRATCPAHLIRLDFTTCTILGKEYRSFSSSLCSFLRSPVTSSLLGPNTFLHTLFSNTLSLRPSLNVSDQVSHPYKTTGKIIILYILIFKFLERNLKHTQTRTHTHTHMYINHLKPTGYYMYHQFNIQQFYVLPTFMCFVWIWEQTAIISLYSINWLLL